MAYIRLTNTHSNICGFIELMSHHSIMFFQLQKFHQQFLKGKVISLTWWKHLHLHCWICWIYFCFCECYVFFSRPYLKIALNDGFISFKLLRPCGGILPPGLDYHIPGLTPGSLLLPRFTWSRLQQGLWRFSGRSRHPKNSEHWTCLPARQARKWECWRSL